MKEINKLLKKNSLRAYNYKKIGKAIKICTTNGDYIIKKKIENNDIFNYLVSRDFNYYPDIIDFDNNYEITRYIEEIDIPVEQKMNDLVYLVSLLHRKTSYYKETDEAEYKKLYEDLENNLVYLEEYYSQLITIIESKVYMSPPEYLFARNISVVFLSIDKCKKMIDNWLNKINNLKKMRVAVVHNNLKLSHFIKSKNDYLVSWDKAKIDLPVFDLYKLYLNHALEFDFYELLKKYEHTYPLKDYELDLFFILILMPNKIEFNQNNYEMCQIIRKELEKISKTDNLVEQYLKAKKNLP